MCLKVVWFKKIGLKKKRSNAFPRNNNKAELQSKDMSRKSELLSLSLDLCRGTHGSFHRLFIWHYFDVVFFLKKHPVPYESFIDEKWKVKNVNVLKKLYLLLPITCFFVLYAFNTVAVLGFISLTLLANMQTFGGTKINQSLYKKGPSVSLA